ncbi:ROK family protein [Nocardia stercoris]|uniref:ROK family protein n=1 Tax=Nocardia stercoris TaxID=2483361 RepID=A0A3M2LE35_9NOCA|nr:ROK family protein [Nocardia stercoris]RMI32958.1 ROK family protein [Nocardia stercoris]
MTALALEISPSGFAAGRPDEDNDDDSDIRRVPILARDPWDDCRKLLLEVAGGRDVTTVGIGCAGPIDMGAGVVAPPDIARWRTGFEIVSATKGLFPRATVLLALDGVCAALAERAFGATAEVMDSLVLTLGDRIAGGATAGGFAMVGRTGNAGNIGHLLVPGFDEPCDCGGRGCLEAVAGGRSVVRWARQQGWGGQSVIELAAAAAAGDEPAVAAARRAGTALGLAISSAAALLDVDLVVLGGPLSEAGPALWRPLGDAVAAHARLGSLTGLRVVPSPLGQMSVLAGAGLLAMRATG